MKRSILVTLGAAGLVAVGLAGCGQGRKEITETRTVTPAAPAAAATDEGHAHGDACPVKPGMTGEMPGAPAMDAPKKAERSFSWETPDGWTSSSPTAMRLVNLRVGEAECYVTVLKGSGGGAERNINRWRDQMGQESLSEADIANLPKIAVLGKEAPMVEISGTFSGMGTDGKEGYMLLGTVCEDGSQSVFVKMTGPEATVSAEREKFVAFCKSLK